jgi:hypothetical protein
MIKAHIPLPRCFSLLLFALTIGGFTARAFFQGGRTGSPHGDLKIACGNCHTTVSWKPIRPYPDFDHRKTNFQLRGAHANADCRSCHVQLVFSRAGSACLDCHADIHRSQLGGNCEQCHTVRGWRTLSKSVNGHENRFPLWGAHAALECESCHKSAAVSQFRGLSSDCNSCHLKDSLNVKTVNHQSAGFSTKCNACHSSDSWVSGFDHAKLAGFPLVGAHARLDCLQCHVGGRFAGTPANCVGCHLQDFNRATDPNHIQSNFPQDCSVCHSTSAWMPASFNHNITRFPLTGAHAQLQCPACHSTGQYANLPTTCISCHLADYSGTTNPNHASAGFPQDCSICHTSTAWTPASFDHSKTKFPLTGAHVNVACASCHISGVYSGTPTSCYSCHSKEYNSTTDPAHASAGFPTDCTQCHTTSSWSGAVFTHTWFPIYSGSHAGRWTVCGDCHTNAANYSVFSCVTCHAHDKTTTDANHRGVPNYVYNSANCYACHPTGRGGD